MGIDVKFEYPIHWNHTELINYLKLNLELCIAEKWIRNHTINIDGDRFEATATDAPCFCS